METKPDGSRPGVVGRPTLRDALRASVFGSGSLEWVSRKRKRIVQTSLFGGGLLTGLLFALFVDQLPEGALDGPATLIVIVLAVVLLAVYLVHDVTMVFELIEKRQTQSDLDLARQIQLRMLPRALPDLPGYAIGVYHEAARSVGGDAYDVLRLDDDHVFLTIADVSGKGTAAAMLMSGVLARTRALARTGMPINEVAARLSAALDEETETVHFATLVIGVLELSTGILRYVNAGNQPPVILRRDGSRVELGAGGIPVGMLPNVTYTPGQAFLGRGDRLIVATDGVFDADDQGTALLTEDELERLLSEDELPDDGLDRVRREVRRRTGPTRFDDITVMVVRRVAQASSDAPAEAVG